MTLQPLTLQRKTLFEHQTLLKNENPFDVESALSSFHSDDDKKLFASTVALFDEQNNFTKQERKKCLMHLDKNHL
jgi:hypothetical protein